MTDPVREILDRLDLAAQIEAEQRMREALDAMPTFEPEEEDWEEYEQWLERLEYERGCDMRFM